MNHDLSHLPTGTVTFFISDIEGSTLLWEAHPQGMRAALARHDEILRTAVESNGGSVIKTTGDGLYAVFPAAHDAATAAIESQKTIAGEPWSTLAADVLKVRIGIHTGEAQERGGDYFGPAVNRTARIMAIGHGGQVLLSSVTADMINDYGEGVTLSDLGNVRLRGLSRPEHVYQLQADGLMQSFPPLRTEMAVAGTLLRQLTSFAGPDQEKAELTRLLYDEPLTAGNQALLLQLIEGARARQEDDVLYEGLYKQLSYLFVLKGSRANALAELVRHVRGLEVNQNAILFISGKSGIGKTSLALSLQLLIDQIGARLVVARCSEHESRSYALWREIGRSLTMSGGSSASLPEPLGGTQPADSLQQLVFGLADWLDEQAGQQPLVLLLDDLHWADADSLDVLDSLTNRAMQAPVVIIVTYRSEEKHLDHALYDVLPKLQRNRPAYSIHLSPLTLDDTQRLANAAVGPSSQALARYLFDRAEGHPFFTIALLNDLVEQHLLPQDGQGAWLPPDETTDVPDILRRLILRRVARLGDAASRLLTIAAIAGESWPLKIVEQLVEYGEETLLEALEQALRAELIVVEDDREEIYRFAHGLINQVLCTDLIARRRKHIHKQIAEQIERQDPDNIDALAHHFYEAEAWAKAFQYGSEAGEQAAKSFANNRALGLYQQALEAAQYAHDDIEPWQLLDAYERLGNAYDVLDRQQEAEITFSRMRDTAQSLDDVEAEVRALAQLAITRVSLYQMDVAEQTAHEALKIGQRIKNPRLLVRIHLSLVKLHIIQGQMEKVAFHSKKIQHYAQDLNDPAPLSSAFRQQAYTAIWSGQYVEAEALAQQSLALGQKAGIPLHISGGTQILSYSQIEAGKYREAYRNIRSIVDLGETADPYHHQLPRLLNQMGYLYLELGDAEKALIWDRRAFEASRNSPGTSKFEMQRYSLLNLATDYLHLDEIDEALKAIAQFEAVKEALFFVRFRYYNRYLLLMAELRLAQNDFTKAIAFASEARDLAAQYKNPKNIARSYWLEGRAHLQLGITREAIPHMQEAVKIADEIRHGSLRWKFRLDLARAQIDAGEPPAATIKEARAMVDQTADYLSGSHLQDSFPSSPWMAQIEALEKSRQPKKPAYPAGLTPREVEVLRLVAKGATNQQVADELHISVRTVNTHMTNIFNKTGCDNRTAAGAFAIQNNLLTT